jgi:hypothetical protein
MIAVFHHVDGSVAASGAYRDARCDRNFFSFLIPPNLLFLLFLRCRLCVYSLRLRHNLRLYRCIIHFLFCYLSSFLVLSAESREGGGRVPPLQCFSEIPFAQAVRKLAGFGGVHPARPNRNPEPSIIHPQK